MSVGRPNTTLIISEEQYRANQARIQEARDTVDHFAAMNEEARRNNELQMQLLKRIEEGKEAERILQALRGGAVPSAPLEITGTNQQIHPESRYQTMAPPPRPANVANLNGNAQAGFFNAQSRPQWESLAASSQTANRTQRRPGPTNDNVPQGPSTVPHQHHHHQQRWAQLQQPQSHPQGQSYVQRARPYDLQAPNALKQAISVVRGRQPLPMQPVVTQIQNPLRVEQHVPSVSYGAPPSADYTGTMYNATNSTFRLPAASTSSSLAGALDERPQKPPASIPASEIPSRHNGSIASSPASIPASSASMAVPSSTEAPLTAAARVDTPMGTPNPTAPAAFMANLLNTPAATARLKAMIDTWEPDAPPHSFFSLPGSQIKVYKDLNSKIFLVVPENSDATRFMYLDVAQVFAKLASTMLDVAANVPVVGAEQAKSYLPYNVPPQPSSSRVASTSLADQPKPTGSVLPPLPSSLTADTSTTGRMQTHEVMPSSAAPPAIPPRTPAEADKKRLAKDILRALGSSPQKRSRPADLPSSPSTAHPAKRHAPEQDLGGRSLVRAPTTTTTTTFETSYSDAEVARPPIAVSSEAPVVDIESIHFYRPKASGQYNRDIHEQIAPDVTYIPSKWSSEVSSLPPPLLSKPSPTAPSAPSTTTDARIENYVNGAATSTKMKSGEFDTATDPKSLGIPSPAYRTPTITYLSRTQTPLFLPSPSSSPPTSAAHESIPRVQHQIFDVDEEPGASRQTEKKKQPFYVLVPSPPDYVLKYKAQLSGRRRSQANHLLVDGTDSGIERRSTSRLVEAEDVFDIDPASNGFVNDDNEREAVLLSCSRISERPCKWNGCTVVMSSAAKLIEHFASEHRPQSASKNLFVCMWQQCGRRERNTTQLFSHLRSHAIIPLLCAYGDCEESFRTPRQLARHHQGEHSNDPPKRSASIYAPELEMPVAVPEVVPSYLIEPARHASMSKERHAVIGPWVLRNIAGPVNIEKRYNAAKRLQSSGGERRRGNQPYDFLHFPSTNFSTTPSQPSRLRDLGDLDSGEVSELVNDGMVLWHASEMKDEDGDDVQLLGSLTLGTKRKESTVGQTVGSDATEQIISSDEEAVENMLAI